MTISSKEQLYAESQQIQNYCEITPSDDPSEVVERGNTLVAYIARTGKMLADAKHHAAEARRSEIVAIIKELTDARYSAKVQNTLIDSVAKDEQYLVDWIERLNRTCVHQLEWCRTIVSKAKEEMRLGTTLGREFGQ